MKRFLTVILTIILVFACLTGFTVINKSDGHKLAEQKSSPHFQGIKEKIAFADSTEMKVPDSGIRICIDPGHFAGANVLQFSDGTSYCEGEVTIKIAQELQKILKEKYGITADLTRDSGTININGYVNRSLDGGHIRLRGEKSAGYDLFVSIHTNANKDGANGYPTCSQPVDVNKPVLIANTVAVKDETAIRIGNEIGSSLAEADEKMEVGSASSFQKATYGQKMKEWTDYANDTVGVPGTIFVRTGSSGDYYGVLHGASNVGTPGFIIEHGHHTVPEVRKLLKDGELIRKWAEADAEGIARGFGLIR